MSVMKDGKEKERKGRTNTASKMNERIYRLLQHGKALVASELRQKWRELRARISTRSLYCILHGSVHRRGGAPSSLAIPINEITKPDPSLPTSTFAFTHTTVGRKSCHVMSSLRVRKCSCHFPLPRSKTALTCRVQPTACQA
jgi:hypothetical protein